jgi:hypothetical protein
MSKFHLAVRMIGHEARTGTIRSCTGFSEDRIRKIYTTYFRDGGALTVRRHRGKSPSRISSFLCSAARQSESTVLACLLLSRGVMHVDAANGVAQARRMDPVLLGEGVCDAYETYCSLYPSPAICFERTWSLYNALVKERELFFARCNDCGGPYIQDRYALDYAHCPFCDIKHS